MKASDVMVRKVITTHPQAAISEVARVLVDNDVSALPVVDDQGHMVGVISEAPGTGAAQVGRGTRFARSIRMKVSPGA